MQENMKKKLKKIKKFLFGNSIFQWFVAIVISMAIWFIYITCRVKKNNWEVFHKYKRSPAIFVFWHGRTMMLSPMVFLGGLRAYVIASRHTDGRAMAKLQRLFGMRAILGSSSEGGVQVLRQGVRMLRKGGFAMCMSPDGPSGPSMRLKDGALYFAEMTGVPIIPVCYTCSKPWFQSRWDRYLVALPFSKIECTVGTPIFLKNKMTECEREQVRQKIENVMNKQLRDLDKKYNLFKVEQDLTASEFKKQKRSNKK